MWNEHNEEKKDKYRKLLRRFFKENAERDCEIPTSAELAHFQIKLLLYPETNEQFHEVINEVVFKEHSQREEAMLAERNELESANYDQIIRFMRRGLDPVNQDILVNRALVFEDEIVPEIIRRLKTSLNDGFIESATKVLSLCKKDIANELIGYYNDVRNPYTQSMILVVLGFKADETYIPWIIEKYKELKKLYPDEYYYDGAYCALYEMEDRFYPVVKK